MAFMGRDEKAVFNRYMLHGCLTPFEPQSSLLLSIEYGSVSLEFEPLAELSPTREERSRSCYS